MRAEEDTRKVPRLKLSNAAERSRYKVTFPDPEDGCFHPHDRTAMALALAHGDHGLSRGCDGFSAHRRCLEALYNKEDRLDLRRGGFAARLTPLK